MTFSEKCVNKPVTTKLLFILAIVLGIFCTTQLPVDMFPEMDLPYMMVFTQYDGCYVSAVSQVMTAFCAHICVLGQMSSFEFLLRG